MQVSVCVSVAPSISLVPFHATCGPQQYRVPVWGAQLLGPERRSEWGRTRLWGAVGWGIVAPIAGFIVDQTSPL